MSKYVNKNGKEEEVVELINLQDENSKDNTNKDEEDTAKTSKVIPVKNSKSYRKDIDLKMMVICRNVTSGTLTYISRKTGFEAHWTKFGDTEYIDVAELIHMKSAQPRFLNEPWIIIDDDEVVEYIGLKEMYDKVIQADDVASFFTLQPIEIEAKLKVAPNGTRLLVGEQARIMIENDKLYDNRVIRTLEKELQIDLSMFTK